MEGVMRRIANSNRRIPDAPGEYLRSNALDLVSIEDLVESPHPMGYDASIAEWAFVAHKPGSRKPWGTLLMKLHDDGQIKLRIE